MDETRRLRQTWVRFGSEAERVLGGNFLDMPAPLERLVDAIDSEPLVSAHVAACVRERVGAGFDARAEVSRVAGTADATFGPFAEDGRAALAERYLVASELVRLGTKFSSPVFAGYGGEGARLQGRAQAFMDELVLPLIEGVRAHLRERAAACGVDLEAPDAQVPAPVDAPEEATAGELLRTLAAEAEPLAASERMDVLLQVEALSDELSSGSPKPVVVRALMRGLAATCPGSLSGTLDALEKRLRADGIL